MSPSNRPKQTARFHLQMNQQRLKDSTAYPSLVPPGDGPIEFVTEKNVSSLNLSWNLPHSTPSPPSFAFVRLRSPRGSVPGPGSRTSEQSHRTSPGDWTSRGACRRVQSGRGERSRERASRNATGTGTSEVVLWSNEGGQDAWHYLAYSRSVSTWW